MSLISEVACLFLHTLSDTSPNIDTTRQFNLMIANIPHKTRVFHTIMYTEFAVGK